MSEIKLKRKSYIRTPEIREKNRLAMLDKFKGKDNPNWRGGKIRKECLFCKKVFYVIIARNNAKFCSAHCFGKFNMIHSSYKIVTKERNDKISLSHKKRWGNKNRVRRTLKNIIRKSRKYRLWRKEVFERDNWTCKNCGARSGNGKEVYLEAHHKKSFVTYSKLRFDISNGITLCKHCHREINKQQMKGNKNSVKR